MSAKEVRLPDGRIWLRVADPDWVDPLDWSHAQERGGRWNAPGTHGALYLNANVTTARMQVERMLAGTSVRLEDLDDDAYVLVAATLPARQNSADAVSSEGLRALGLPSSYPRTSAGREIAPGVCHEVGETAKAARLRGIWCRSNCTADGRGREVAWFPATSRSHAKAVWATSKPLGQWRDALGWADIGLSEQADPTPTT